MEKSDPFAGWGGSVERLLRVQELVASGEFREDITCYEARREWFVMARNMYVENNPESRLPIDFETGIHTAKCVTDDCQILALFYQEYLVSSHPGSSEMLAQLIDRLEQTMPESSGSSEGAG